MTNTNPAETRPTIAKIEDREFDGTCGACGREGLRWIAVLSDGSALGLECAKRVIGYKPAPTAYAWIGDFRVVAEHVEHGVTYVLWQSRRGAGTRETQNGVLMSVGGARAEWTAKGWL